MSSFVKHFSNMSMKNASHSAYSSCAAANNAACDFNIVNIADTVLAVSVLLFSLIAIISLSLLGLIDIIIIAVIIMGINTISCTKRNEYEQW